MAEFLDHSGDEPGTLRAVDAEVACVCGGDVEDGFFDGGGWVEAAIGE